MRDLAGFREAIEHYRKQVGRTEEELARELYVSKGELNKRLHDYSHPQSKRTWRLQPRHVKTIVETLARWGAITARRQVFILFTLIDFPALAEEIDWQASPWNKLHIDASPTESSPSLSVPVRRRLFQARDLPKEYVPRPNAFSEIKRLLLAQENHQTTAITTALRGAGGFGKTTLALALCHDPEIQEAFPDGILWVDLGEHPPRPLDVLNDQLHVLEPSEREALTLEEARERWRSVLEERIYLLVIDDVWQTDALKELLQGGPQCGRLITTRNDQILPDETRKVWVDAMEAAEAMVLLCEGVTDDWQHILDPSVLEHVVVQQLGCWPLLVSLARGMLKNQVERLHKAPKQALATLKHAYEERGMATFHLGDRDERQRNVDACLEVNLRQLEEWVPVHYQARQRYLELAVFPEDTDVALSILQIYWKGTGGLREYEVEELCLHLSDFSLLLPRRTEHPTIRVHDVLRSYLIQRVGNQFPTLHQRLLDAHQQHYHLTRWADLLQNETYLWQRLVFHLCRADKQEALQTTLTDLNWLMRKALYVGVSALEADLLLASMFQRGNVVTPAQMLFEFLHRKVVRLSHLLQQAQTPAEMGGLLLSHLGWEPHFTTKRNELEGELPRPFLMAWHPLPKESSSKLLRILHGHTSHIFSCAVSPDDSFIVSASDDGTLKVWDTATGSPRLTLKGGIHLFGGCAVSPDGHFIVSTSYDGGGMLFSAKVWDSATGAELRTLFGHTRQVTGFAVSPNSKWIVSASWDHTLKVWDAATGAERHTLSGHTDWVNSCAFSPDGQWIVSASQDQTLKVWDAATGKERRTLSAHTSPVNCCVFSPDSRFIVSASGALFGPDEFKSDCTLKVWDAATGVERFTLTGHADAVNGCAFSPDGRFIVSASSDGTLKIWDALTGTEHLTLTGHTSSVLCCAVSPKGRFIVSASQDGALNMWDGIIEAESLTLKSPRDKVWGCSVSPDGRFIVSASGNPFVSDGTLKVWRAATGRVRRTLRGHIYAVYNCAFSPDGQWIVSASQDRTLKVWGAASGEERFALTGHTYAVYNCAFSPDGQWIVSASQDRTLKVWDTATGAERFTLSGHSNAVYGCAFSPDGRWIISASEDQTLKVWDGHTGHCQLTFPMDGELYSCAFYPDGEQLVVCGTLGVYFLRLVV